MVSPSVLDVPLEEYDLVSVAGFLRLLSRIDLQQLLSDSAQSTDEYSRNPRTLLEDILMSLDPKDDQDAIIDCY